MTLRFRTRFRPPGLPKPTRRLQGRDNRGYCVIADGEPFLKAILADPLNDGPRLVYADWLDERGDPARRVHPRTVRIDEPRALWVNVPM
jgi:uncharacterized protein (TIGR02996 family)